VTKTEAPEGKARQDTKKESGVHPPEKRGLGCCTVTWEAAHVPFLCGAKERQADKQKKLGGGKCNA